VEPSARRALDDLGPLELGNGTQDSEGKFVLGVVNVVLAVDVRFLAILPPASADWRPQTNPAGRWPDRGLEYC
jgi:hypothetical protein